MEKENGVVRRLSGEKSDAAVRLYFARLLITILFLFFFLSAKGVQERRFPLINTVEGNIFQR